MFELFVNSKKRKTKTIKSGRERNANSKTNAILNHLEENGSITSWDAFELYRATRLSAVIFNLRLQGFNIETIKSGNKSNYATYILHK